MAGSGSGARQSMLRANVTLGVLVAAYIVSFIDRQILSLMVNPVRADLQLSDFEISLVQGLAFSLFYCTMGLPLGRMADRINRTRLIAAGILIWSLATIACGYAGNFAELFAARLMVGFGEAVLLPAGVSLLVDLYDRERQVRAISIFTMGGLLGGGIAFLVGGSLIELLNSRAELFSFLPAGAPWQQVFILVGLPGLVLAPLLLLLREPPRRQVSQEGHVSFGRAMAFLWSVRARIGPYFLVASLLAVISFAGPAWYPTHLLRSGAIGAGEVGLYLGIIHLVSGPLGVFMGVSLTERFSRSGRPEPHLLTSILAAVTALAGLPAMLIADAPTALILWGFVMLGQGMFFGSLMGAVQAQLPNQYRAVGAALMMIFMSMIGLAAGTALVGLLADLVFAGDPRGIGKALAIVLGLAAAMAILVAVRARGRAEDGIGAAALSEGGLQSAP